MTAFDAPTRAPVHLSPEATTLLRSLLLCEFAEQSDQAEECRYVICELTGQSDVDSLLEREIAQASLGKAEAAMREARQALVRLDDGRYGTCERCAEHIPFERLEAVPHTRRCIRCPDSWSSPGLLG
jgi:RNA polymerase-binding transcription factor DksA